MNQLGKHVEKWLQPLSDVDILKKSISIRYNIFKMLVIKEICYGYNLHPGMLDRYFLATFHIIEGLGSKLNFVQNQLSSGEAKNRCRPFRS